MYLEKPLGAAFVVHKYAIRLGKGSGGNEDACLGARGCGRMINHNHFLAFAEELVHDFCLCMAIEVVFDDDYGVGVIVHDGVESGVKAVTAHHGETHRVAFGQRHHDTR